MAVTSADVRRVNATEAELLTGLIPGQWGQATDTRRIIMRTDSDGASAYTSACTAGSEFTYTSAITFSDSITTRLISSYQTETLLLYASNNDMTLSADAGNINIINNSGDIINDTAVDFDVIASNDINLTASNDITISATTDLELRNGTSAQFIRLGNNGSIQNWLESEAGQAFEVAEINGLKSFILVSTLAGEESLRLNAGSTGFVEIGGLDSWDCSAVNIATWGETSITTPTLTLSSDALDIDQNQFNVVIPSMDLSATDILLNTDKLSHTVDGAIVAYTGGQVQGEVVLSAGTVNFVQQVNTSGDAVTLPQGTAARNGLKIVVHNGSYIYTGRDLSLFPYSGQLLGDNTINDFILLSSGQTFIGYYVHSNVWCYVVV